MISRVLLDVVIPITITGGLFSLIVLVLQIFKRGLSGWMQKALIVCAVVLYVVPFGLMFNRLRQNTTVASGAQPNQTETAAYDASAAGDTQTDIENTEILQLGHEDGTQNIAEPQQDNTAAVDYVLDEMPVTSSVYNAGQEIGNIIQKANEMSPQKTVDWLVVIYTAGLGLFLGYMLLKGMAFGKKLARDSDTITNGWQIDVMNELAAEMGIRKLPRLVQSRLVSSPIFAGVFKPVLVIPDIEMSRTEFAYAARHEFIHYKHRDLQMKIMLLVLSAVHWMNPLIHLLRYHHAQICEQHCDEAVVNLVRGEGQKEYAATILRFAAVRVPFAATGMATPKRKLKGRILSIMRPNGIKKTIKVIMAAAILLLLSISLLVGCGLFGGDKTEIEGIWVADFGYDSYIALAIEEEMLYRFVIQTEDEITSENIGQLLSQTPAYAFEYKYSENELTITEQMESGSAASVTYQLTLAETEFEIVGAKDSEFLNGEYNFISGLQETTNYINANGILTQSYMQGTWIHEGAAGYGFHYYSILSVCDDRYSNIFVINTTANLVTDTFDANEGFLMQINEDVTIADSFYDFKVLDDRTLEVEMLGEETGDVHFGNYNGTYSVIMTNKGIYLLDASGANMDMDGFYYKNTPRTDVEGIWMETVHDNLDGNLYYYFITLEDGTVTYNREVLDAAETIDHSDPLEHYENSSVLLDGGDYSVLDNGVIKQTIICFWPVYLTDNFCIWGSSDGPNLLPEYWYGVYRVM